MITIKNETFCITGIAIRTSNDPGAAEKDIPQLWNTFLSGKLADQIPGKIGNDIYCVYTDYEKDYTKPYTAVLGCRVAQSAPVPEGFRSVIIQAGNYRLFTAKGDLHKGIVFNEWINIWNLSVKRAYTTDYEVYGTKAQDPANAEVDIFVALV